MVNLNSPGAVKVYLKVPYTWNFIAVFFQVDHIEVKTASCHFVPLGHFQNKSNSLKSARFLKIVLFKKMPKWHKVAQSCFEPYMTYLKGFNNKISCVRNFMVMIKMPIWPQD